MTLFHQEIHVADKPQDQHLSEKLKPVILKPCNSDGVYFLILPNIRATSKVITWFNKVQMFFSCVADERILYVDKVLAS